MVSGTGIHGTVRINQDAELYLALLQAGEEVTHTMGTDRHAWIQVARGSLELIGIGLSAGDGAAVSDEHTLTIVGRESTEFLLFDLA